MDPVNPYAAPLYPVEPIGEAVATAVPYREWTPTEIVREAWERFKEDWTVLLGSLVIGWVISVVGTWVPQWLALGRVSMNFTIAEVGWPVFIAVNVFGQVIGALVGSGWTAVVVASASRTAPTLGTFFNGLSRCLPYLGAVFLMMLCTLCAAIFFIIPGIIVFLGLCQATYLTVDRKMGPIEALRASWRITRGLKGQISIVFLLQALIGLGGLLACGIGLFVALPVVLLTSGVLYTRLVPRLSMPETAS